jgi:hypothetical protein
MAKKILADVTASGNVSAAKGLVLPGTTAPVSVNGSVGTAGQALVSGGANATPSWASVVGTSSSYFAGHNPEGRLMYNTYLTNDMANARLRGSAVSATQNGSPYSISNANWDAMFDGTATFFNISPTSGFTFPLVITVPLPRTLTYGTWVGLSFGSTTFRANSVTIEVFSLDSNSWVNIFTTTTNTSEDIFVGISGVANSNATGISRVRYTISAPNSTQLRLQHLWAYNFNSDMWSQTMMPRAGGSFYGPVTAPGLTLNGSTSPITLNTNVGTSGQVLTSAGAGATPTWTTPSAGGTFTGGTLTSGLVLAAGTTTLQPVRFQSGTNLTTPVAGVGEYDGTVFYKTSNTNPGRALDVQSYYYVSNSTYFVDASSGSVNIPLIGASVTAVNGVNVASGTTYEYEVVVALEGGFFAGQPSQTPTINLTSTTISGTPTVAHTTILETGNNTTGFNNPITLGATRITGATALTALTTGVRYYLIKMSGTVRVTGSGVARIVPTVNFNAGSSENGWSVLSGAKFKLTPIGNGTVTSVGAWA